MSHSERRIMIVKHTLFVDRSLHRIGLEAFTIASRLNERLSFISIQEGHAPTSGDRVCTLVLDTFDGLTTATDDKRSLIDLAHELRLASVKAHRSECVIKYTDMSPIDWATMRFMFFEKAEQQAFFIIKIQLEGPKNVKVRTVEYSHPEWSPTANV